MKYILICTAALAVCLGGGFFAANCLMKKSKKGKKGLKTFLLTMAFGLAFMVLVTLCYMSIHYRPGEKAAAALNGSDTVTVRDIEGGLFFDGPGTGTALVFYPGAKVACKAYAPLMLRLAETGFDCFLADMPFNFAIFGSNMADRFLSAYSYDRWIMVGHSMGGLVACQYAEKHPEQIDGIVLLASYPTAKMDEHIGLISVYGTEDGCLNRNEYEKGKALWPQNARELVIDGGNHAQFGDYGAQKGDGTALLPADEQLKLTVDSITDLFLNDTGTF